MSSKVQHDLDCVGFFVVSWIATCKMKGGHVDLVTIAIVMWNNAIHI